MSQMRWTLIEEVGSCIHCIASERGYVSFRQPLSPEYLSIGLLAVFSFDRVGSSDNAIVPWLVRFA